MAARASHPVRAGQDRRVETAVRRAAAGKKLVLAVSGGRDSMALLHAFARGAPRSVAVVATFDHGTGAAATRAAAHVARESVRLGFPVVVGHASVPASTEATWRDARLAFLQDVATITCARVATAHTRDDHVETVLMRVMRDAGARGLAGLYASTRVVRPLLEFTRGEVEDYALAAGVTWIEDPTNASTRFLRNRVRRDLLPALHRAQASLHRELLVVSREAAAWRERLDAAVAALSTVDDHGVSASAEALTRFSTSELSVVWPAIAARVGLAMDWRGTERAAAFTRESRIGARIPLTGGWEIARDRDAFVLRRGRQSTAAIEKLPLELLSGVRWKDWTFVATRDRSPVSDEWVALLPTDAALTIRRWAPGDRMRVGSSARKVKRFLSDAHVSGARRGEWPVVLAGDEIVWIPGVRRSDAATVRPGRPGVLYRCELNDR